MKNLPSARAVRNDPLPVSDLYDDEDGERTTMIYKTREFDVDIDQSFVSHQSLEHRR